jgi:ribosome biogenesis GTPase / thiamine phosphate phosphatase
MGLKARIHVSSKRVFECLPDGQSELVSATAPAKMLKADHLVVGDNVTIDQAQEGGWAITDVEERTSIIFRNIQRERVKKVIAANVDAVLIIASAGLPTYKRRLVDRYLVRARQWGLPALVVFNKMDLFDGSFDMKFETERLSESETVCFEVSAEHPDRRPVYLQNGFHELAEKLKGNTAILLGQSGVGKSRLIKELSGGKADLASGILGKVGKGQHTTTWAELVDCGSFTLVDSPGVRSMSLSDLTEEELLACFPDIAEKGTHCKFSNCTHEENVKGCWFQALNEKDQGRALVLSRLESYKRILSEVQGIPDWEKDP